MIRALGVGHVGCRLAVCQGYWTSYLSHTLSLSVQVPFTSLHKPAPLPLRLYTFRRLNASSSIASVAEKVDITRSASKYIHASAAHTLPLSVEIVQSKCAISQRFSRYAPKTAPKRSTTRGQLQRLISPEPFEQISSVRGPNAS